MPPAALRGLLAARQGSSPAGFALVLPPAA